MFGLFVHDGVSENQSSPSITTEGDVMIDATTLLPGFDQNEDITAPPGRHKSSMLSTRESEFMLWTEVDLSTVIGYLSHGARVLRDHNRPGRDA